jgi:hypothetical protein
MPDSPRFVLDNSDLAISGLIAQGHHTADPQALVSEAEEAGAVPFAAGDRKGNPGQALIGLAVPDKARIHHHDPMALTVPLARQDGAGLEVNAPAIELRSQARGVDCAAIAANLLQQANRVGRQIP